MTDVAYDSFWRYRIRKEEQSFKHFVRSSTANIKMNTLGAPTIVALHRDPLTGSPRTARDATGETPRSAGSPVAMSGHLMEMSPSATARSALQSRQSRRTGRDSASYPATPKFSVAGSESGAALMGRLQRLELELAQERLRLQAAEEQVKELLTSSGRRQ